MQGIKTLVIGMGALIVIGLALLVYGVYHQATDLDTAPAQDAPQKWNNKQREPLKAFGDVDIALPEGCHITDMSPTRGRRLFLMIGPSGAPCERIVVFDLKKAEVMGTLHVKTKP